jgi:hypothetical protein
MSWPHGHDDDDDDDDDTLMQKPMHRRNLGISSRHRRLYYPRYLRIKSRRLERLERENHIRPNFHILDPYSNRALDRNDFFKARCLRKFTGFKMDDWRSIAERKGRLLFVILSRTALDSVQSLNKWSVS